MTNNTHLVVHPSFKKKMKIWAAEHGTSIIKLSKKIADNNDCDMFNIDIITLKKKKQNAYKFPF